MLKDYSGVSVLEPKGDLGKQEISSLCRTISSLLQRNWVRVVLNLEQVPHLHYASLQKLVSPLCSLKMASGDLKLAHVNSYHKQLFQVAGVDQHFETYDSLEEAVLSFV